MHMILCITYILHYRVIDTHATRSCMVHEKLLDFRIIREQIQYQRGVTRIFQKREENLITFKITLYLSFQEIGGKNTVH